MKLTTPVFEKKKEKKDIWEETFYLFAETIYYTILPIMFFALAMNDNKLYLLLIAIPIFFRIKR